MAQYWIIITKAVLIILKLKVYIGYKRVQRNISKLININKEMIDSESGYSKNCIEVDKKYTFWKPTQIDKVAAMMND